MKLLQAQKLAEQAMANYDLHDWVFTFDNSKRRFGVCRHTRRIISLSRSLVELNDEEIVRDTILHEIAHALAGYEAGHGHRWKQTARAIGCTAERCYDSKNVITPEPNYIGYCPSCNMIVQRYRKKNIACGNCCNKYNGGRYSDRYAIAWS